MTDPKTGRSALGTDSRTVPESPSHQSLPPGDRHIQTSLGAVDLAAIRALGAMGVCCPLQCGRMPGCSMTRRGTPRAAPTPCSGPKASTPSGGTSEPAPGSSPTSATGSDAPGLRPDQANGGHAQRQMSTFGRGGFDQVCADRAARSRMPSSTASSIRSNSAAEPNRNAALSGRTFGNPAVVETAADPTSRGCPTYSTRHMRALAAAPA